MKWRELGRCGVISGEVIEELVRKAKEKSGDRVDHSLGESEEMWKEK